MIEGKKGNLLSSDAKIKREHTHFRKNIEGLLFESEADMSSCILCGLGKYLENENLNLIL